MKIIRIIGHETISDIDFHPDSALLLPGRPLFYPDFGGTWAARLYVAVHINRLGKGMSEKFAPRYYDSLSIGLQIEPQNLPALPAGVLSGLDNSITHGEWLTPAEILDTTVINIGAGNMDVTMPSGSIINRAISHIGTYTTLRMGDILLIPLDTALLPISPRSRLTISTPSATVINLKIV